MLTDDGTDAPRPEAAPVLLDAPRRTASRSSAALVIGLLALNAVVLAVVLTSFRGAAVYSKGADEVVAEQDRLMGRNLRVQGTLVKGTLVSRAWPCEHRFLVERNGTRLPVVYPHCTVPDTFRDVPYQDVQVTAEGQLAADGHLEATSIMAKCPSKYEMKDRSDRGEAAPHALPATSTVDPS
jgi:cytochrome c-type biogenesis protein CcmE